MKAHPGWQLFLNWCEKATDPTLKTELFALILTPEERSSLQTRCQIIEALLADEKTQRQLSEELKVSIAKITRGSNELKRISPRLKKFLKMKKQ